jgi:hypothetical protein
LLTIAGILACVDIGSNMAPVKKKRAAPYANKPKAVKAKPTPIVKVNKQGGTYIKGTSYSLDMKTRFHHHLEQLKEEATANGGKAVTATVFAAKAGISIPFAIKIMVEDKAGTIVDPKEKKRAKPGMGSKSLSLEDEIFLLTLYRLQPSTSLARYVKVLFEEKGTKVSPATLSRWFNTRFPFKGKKVKTCNVQRQQQQQKHRQKQQYGSRMAAVQVNDEGGNSIGRVKVGETVLVALRRLHRDEIGGLYDNEDLGLLQDDIITAEGAPYVFKQ